MIALLRHKMRQPFVALRLSIKQMMLNTLYYIEGGTGLKKVGAFSWSFVPA
jgi:hypothetical protein